MHRDEKRRLRKKGSSYLLTPCLLALVYITLIPPSTFPSPLPFIYLHLLKILQQDNSRSVLFCFCFGSRLSVQKYVLSYTSKVSEAKGMQLVFFHFLSMFVLFCFVSTRKGRGCLHAWLLVLVIGMVFTWVGWERMDGWGGMGLDGKEGRREEGGEVGLIGEVGFVMVVIGLTQVSHS